VVLRGGQLQFSLERAPWPTCRKGNPKGSLEDTSSWEDRSGSIERQRQLELDARVLKSRDGVLLEYLAEYSLTYVCARTCVCVGGSKGVGVETCLEAVEHSF
jgi:hypothetical protein